jgi:hypothetical protein
MNPPKKKMSRMIGVPTAVVLGVFVTGAGAGVASAATHSAKSTHAHITLMASTAKPRANQSGPGAMPGGCNGMGGDVIALTGSAITVLNREGSSTTYAITSTTTVTKDRASSTIAALALGESVHINVSSTDATTATSIDIVPANIAGKVTAVSGDTITIAGPDGTTGTIDVTSSTTFAKSGATASLSDVTVGSFVFAEGTFGATATTIDATSVGIGQPSPGTGPGPRGFAGGGQGGPGGPGPMGAFTPPSS